MEKWQVGLDGDNSDSLVQQPNVDQIHGHELGYTVLKEADINNDRRMMFQKFLLFFQYLKLMQPFHSVTIIGVLVKCMKEYENLLDYWRDQLFEYPMLENLLMGFVLNLFRITILVQLLVVILFDELAGKATFAQPLMMVLDVYH